MSDTQLVETGFGVECRVFAEAPPAVWPADLAAADAEIGIVGPKRATWSFVNDVWADAVADAESFRTGPIVWKDELGDDFVEKQFKVDLDDQPLPFKRPPSAERRRCEDLVAELGKKPEAAFVGRLFASLRTKGGMHGVRKARRACVAADRLAGTARPGSGAAGGGGMISVATFQGVLLSRGVLLQSSELEALCRAFHAENGFMSYTRFFDSMEGVMSDARRGVVERAYRRLRLVARGQFVTVDDLMANWSPKCYPEVEAGVMDEKDAFQDFLSQWEVGHHEGRISAEDFMAYYRDVSMSFEDPVEFVGMMRKAYDL